MYYYIKNVFILTIVSETTYRKYDGPCENRRTPYEQASCTKPLVLLVSILINNV